MLSVHLLLAVAALIIAIANPATGGRVPLWIAVVLLAILHLIAAALPVR